MTSPVGAMYLALETAMSRRNETAVVIDDAQRRKVLKGLFANYYSEIHPHKLVFDTNRAWSTKLPALAQLFPAAHFICCVRNIAWVMDSVERLVGYALDGLREPCFSEQSSKLILVEHQALTRAPCIPASAGSNGPNAPACCRQDCSTGSPTACSGRPTDTSGPYL